jgi:hypothetical protein
MSFIFREYESNERGWEEEHICYAPPIKEPTLASQAVRFPPVAIMHMVVSVSYGLDNQGKRVPILLRIPYYHENRDQKLRNYEIRRDTKESRVIVITAETDPLWQYNNDSSRYCTYIIIIMDDGSLRFYSHKHWACYSITLFYHQHHYFSVYQLRPPNAGRMGVDGTSRNSTRVMSYGFSGVGMIRKNKIPVSEGKMQKLREGLIKEFLDPFSIHPIMVDRIIVDSSR